MRNSQKSKKDQIRKKNRIGVSFIFTIGLFILILYLSGQLLESIKFPPDLLPTIDTPSLAPIETPYTTLEHTIDSNKYIDTTSSITNQDYYLGNAEIDYPLILQPNTSQVLILKIYISNEVRESDLRYFDRILPISVKPSSQTQGFANYVSPVVITTYMRAILSSPSFKIENRFPIQQKVNTKVTNNPTFWIWTIRAPNSDSVGTHILLLELYLQNTNTPSWIRSIEIEVANPTSTPSWTPTTTASPTMTITQTATPSPTFTATATAWSDPIKDNLKNNFTNIILWILGAIGAITITVLPFIRKHLRRREDVKHFENDISILRGQNSENNLMDEIQKRAENIKDIENKIKNLKSIKWWQIWK